MPLISGRREHNARFCHSYGGRFNLRFRLCRWLDLMCVCVFVPIGGDSINECAMVKSGDCVDCGAWENWDGLFGWELFVIYKKSE